LTGRALFDAARLLNAGFFILLKKKGDWYIMEKEKP